MPPGVYVSVPFCRTKCSFCNFASDVFSRAVFERYVDRVCEDIKNSPQTTAKMGGQFERAVDSIYVGGGTPTLLAAAQLEKIFATARSCFDVSGDAEVTIECAPGTLSEDVMESLLRCGVNRVSLGVQSFVDQEAAAVGRLHNRAMVIEEIARLRTAGIMNINIDLIAGLPHQTAESWATSLVETIASGVPHVSVYMLEVDEGSRLGRELLAGGTSYHAHFVPDEGAVADSYLVASEKLEYAGIQQYEISNFARAGFESRHNLKYWTRQPYFGFGVDAHSMLRSSGQECEAVRFASADSLEQYVRGSSLVSTRVTAVAALEESFFLGLRLKCGVNLQELSSQFGEAAVRPLLVTIAELSEAGLMQRRGEMASLTPRGRLLSNEVFERFISEPEGARAV